MLEESERILQQIEDEDAAQKVGNILAVVDEQFHPCDTALNAALILPQMNCREGLSFTSQASLILIGFLTLWELIYTPVIPEVRTGAKKPDRIVIGNLLGNLGR